LPKRGNPHRQKWKWKAILNALFYVLRTGCQCLLGQSSAHLSWPNFSTSWTEHHLSGVLAKTAPSGPRRLSASRAGPPSGPARWRELPDSFPPWQTLYAYHRRFCKHGVWERLNTALRIRLRLKSQRNAWPSAVVFDTQSVKALCRGEERGFDGYKRADGRKRSGLGVCHSDQDNAFCWSILWDYCCRSRSSPPTPLKR